MPRAKASKKSKKINFYGKNKRPLIVLVSALFVATGIAAVMQTHAATDYVRICYSNDSTSTHPIDLTSSDYNGAILLYKGNCVNVWNRDGSARVYLQYISTASISSENIKSYKKKPDGGSYGPCYRTGTTSNPYNVAKVYYKVYKRADCAT